MDNAVLQVQHCLREQGIMICFSGKLSQDLIEEYGAAVKKYVESEARPASDVYNIFSIFIEQTQNIKNYCNSKTGSVDYDEINNSCIVTIGKTGGANYISSGNLVHHADIEALKLRIEELVTLDKAGLKKLYKDRLREENPNAASAGLGLIDIARKATAMKYSFSPTSNHLSFFTLTAIV